MFATYALYTHHSTVILDKVGAEACTAALADARVRPDYWMRRASLYRARALHHLATGDRASALADLDLAHAQAPDRAEPLYRRGMGAGVDLVRAYILRLEGDQAGAEALALQVFNDRPFSLQTAAGALFAAGPEASWEALRPILERMGELDPELGAELSSFVLEDGELHDAPKLRALLGRGSDLERLFALLPEAEAPGRVPRYGGINLLETEDGYVVHRYPKESSIVVAMFGSRASPAIVQEMALLKAAEVALEKGQAQMFVTGRDARRQSDAHTLYGSVVSTSPNGHRTYIRVKFADEAAVEAASDQWRVMDPAAIRAALAPTYIPPKKKR